MYLDKLREHKEAVLSKNKNRKETLQRALENARHYLKEAVRSDMLLPTTFERSEVPTDFLKEVDDESFAAVVGSILYSNVFA